MRRLGLDESKLAANVDRLLDRLESKDKPRASEKMLLEVLRECGKLLEAYPVARPASAAAALASNVPIQLVTMVPRPERESPAPPDPSAPLGAALPATGQS